MQPEEARLKLRKGKSLREQVYKKLKESILDGTFEAHKRLIEEKLADQLGTSRTPVREAIQKLEKEGLIYRLPKGGFAVSSISDDDIEEVFEIRSILEGYAGYLATKRITQEELTSLEEIVKKGEESLRKNDFEALVKLNTEFHDRLYRASKSKLLYRIINDLKDFIYRFRVVIFRHRPLVEISLKDHREMIELMKTGSAKKVESLIRKHIIRGKKLVKKALKEETKKG
ncbi:MAG: GntR family transcriptional regulator [Desulfobacterota bacterium]|nr:GntR family transcriptional regulator [Thermodesulfobacteriota bacterium]MDW8001487.1 GntR family transcriptional regulator [Deltaproteobacteria bacterium]